MPVRIFWGKGIMKRTRKSLSWLLLAILSVSAQSALAVPVFQVYIDGATAGTVGFDENTWFTTSNSFDLIVSGAYGPQTISLTEVTLLISVPKGETGTISITGGDGAVLLTDRTPAPGCFYNPNADAGLDLLENEAGSSNGYDAYSDKSFLPGDVEFNNHYPFKEDVSNFVLYGLGDFDKVLNAVSNYSTDEPIAYNIADGEKKIYSVLLSGFSAAHFDAYGYLQTDGCKHFESTWSINPGSHDATYTVPEPASLLLLGLGATTLLKPRRKSLPRSS